MKEKNYSIDQFHLTHLHFNEIESTQIYCIDRIEEIANHVTADRMYCATAESQSDGIGKYGARWVSPKGNLYSTYVLQIPLHKGALQIVQSTAVAVSICLERFGVTTKIKWLNDLLLNDKKVSGILCDSVDVGDKRCTIIGIGVNLMNSPHSSWTTSIFEESKINIDLDMLIAELAKSLYKYVLNTDYSEINAIYRDRLAYLNSKVEFIDRGITRFGVIQGLKYSGELEISTNEGIQSFADCKICYPNRIEYTL